MEQDLWMALRLRPPAHSAPYVFAATLPMCELIGGFQAVHRGPHVQHCLLSVPHHQVQPRGGPAETPSLLTLRI